jgi:pimeloyl-ACP methyl ester carboxylesterase
LPLELTRHAHTSRGRIAWDAIGDGPPVVLVHGTPSRALVWRRIAPALASAGRRVYTYDLLGFGASERAVDQDVSLVAHGQVLRELVEDHWRVERPALVGHDIGGAIVLRAHLVEGVAVERIALIDAVVLAPWITPRTRELRERAGDYADLPSDRLAGEIADHLRSATVTRLDDDVFDALFGQWSGAQGQALYLRNAAQFDEDHTREFEPRLGDVDVPVLILWGEDDAWLPLEVSERVEKALPTAKRAVLTDAGHFSMEDQPAELAARLNEFLTRRG